MPRPCLVCSHSNLRGIDLQLLAGVPAREVAAQHGLSDQSVQRHSRNHLRPAISSTGGISPVHLPAQTHGTPSQLPVLQQVVAAQFQHLEHARKQFQADGDMRGLVGTVDTILKHAKAYVPEQASDGPDYKPQIDALSKGLLNLAKMHPEVKLGILNLLDEVRNA